MAIKKVRPSKVLVGTQLSRRDFLKIRFRTRCPYATEACGHDEPLWREVSPEHWVAACHCVN